MRQALAAALALAAVATVSTVASARPITAGVSLGLAEDKVHEDADANQTLGLFGRLGLSKRLSAQLEVSRTQVADEYNYDNANVRKGTVLLVVDLKDTGAWMPILFAGVGIDRMTSDYTSKNARHIEGGFGLEYRASGGFTLGLDVRMGGRSIDDDAKTLPLAGGIEPDVSARTAPCGGDEEHGTIAYYAPAGLEEGEYRTARLTLGVRF